MEVILANHYGFCYGVKRAVKLAHDSIHLEGPAFTLGPIIHNPQMVSRLEKEGVGLIHSLEETTGGTVIIRSHGVGPETYEQAERFGIRLIDATCPHVKKAQTETKKLAAEGYQVVIVGERHHPEVKSIFEWSGKTALIIETLEEAAQVKFMDRLGIVAQTTFSGMEFKKIISVLLDKSNDIKIERTICNATEQRQAAAIVLAKEVDLMIVIGGKNSANTTRLAELCQAAACRTHHIETAAELEADWFDGVERIGITAGASTPDWIIEEVYAKVQDMERLLAETTIQAIKKGEIVRGKVVGIHKDEVFVDLGYKEEGIIALSDLADPLPEHAAAVVKEGDEIDVYVLSADGADGLRLSKVKADQIVAWDKLEAALHNKTIVKAAVTEAVKGGLVVSVFNVRGFIPASQVDLRFIEDLSVFVGSEFDLVLIEVDRDKKRAVLSRRVLLEAERCRKEALVLQSLTVGQVRAGIVKKIADYGAFVDIGGMDGLIHISDLSWERVKHPGEVVQVGDEVSVFVKKFDPQTKRISLSLKEVSRDPWLDKAELMREGSYISGTVTKLMDFGVFVTMENGLDGLIRLAELAEKKIVKAEEVVHLGDVIKVKILQVDLRGKRIGLSLVRAQQDAERAEYRDYMKGQIEQTHTLGDQFGHLFEKFSD